MSCDPVTLEECSDKEKTYVAKMQAKGAEGVAAEKTRLDSMWAANSKSKNLTRKQRKWLEARKKVLEKMVPSEKGEL